MGWDGMGWDGDGMGWDGTGWERGRSTGNHLQGDQDIERTGLPGYETNGLQSLRVRRGVVVTRDTDNRAISYM